MRPIGFGDRKAYKIEKIDWVAYDDTYDEVNSGTESFWKALAFGS